MAFINLKQLWSCANELSRIANLVFVISLQFFQQQKSASLAIRVKDQQLCTKRPERDIFGLLARPPSRRISRCTIVVDDHLRRRRRRWSSSSSSSSSPLPRDYETISAHYPSPSLYFTHTPILSMNFSYCTSSFISYFLSIRYVFQFSFWIQCD